LDQYFQAYPLDLLVAGASFISFFRSLWLPGRDLNPDKLNQNQLCYHYTTGQGGGKSGRPAGIRTPTSSTKNCCATITPRAYGLNKIYFFPVGQEEDNLKSARSHEKNTCTGLYMLYFKSLMSEQEGKDTHKKSPLEYTFRNTAELTRFVTDTGKILPRKYTGLTAKQQRHVSRVIKQARSMMLMQ